MRAPFEYGDSQFTKEAMAEKRLARIERLILTLYQDWYLPPDDLMELRRDLDAARSRKGEVG